MSRRSFLPLVAIAMVVVMVAPHSIAAQRQASFAQPADSTMIKERANFLLLVANQRRTITDGAGAMPADKYGFAPTGGEFANVRTFSEQVRHLAATNYILAAAALGERPPADAGDEHGPDSIVTKAQHLAYLRGSFDALERAARAIGDEKLPLAHRQSLPCKVVWRHVLPSFPRR